MTRAERLDPALPMFPTQDHAKGPGEYVVAMTAERDAQWIALKADAPLRKPVSQDDVDGLGLFDHVRQPGLL